MTGYNTTQNRTTAGRAIISALVMWLAFCSMAAAEQLYVNESGWWRDGGAFNASGASISAAVGAAVAGDAIYVEGGNYYENVDVDKPRLTLEGEGADVVTVTAADSGDHVFEVTADRVNISGFTMTGAPRQIGVFPSGIHLGSGISHCNISNNNASNNYYCGICLSSSSNNTLTNNMANLNIERGICLRDSNNNKLINNIATDARYGISLYHSSNNTLTNNTCSSNSDGILLCDSNHNMLSNNMAISNDNYLMDRCFGILLSSSSNNSLVNNTANSNKYCGIGLYSSSDNEITCNLVQNNTRGGLYLSNSFPSGSINNNISHNNIIKNGKYNTISGGWEWQFWNRQSDSVEAKHNYWGAGMTNKTIDASIYDDEEGGWGEVEFYPFETEPVSCAPTPEGTPAFTTIDAVIALEIAAGSRPPDPRWDLSGDKRVTSLDALMILQAVAHAIDL